MANITPSEVKGRVWTRADTEAVTCCVCGSSGDRIYDLAPFGVVRCPECDLVFVSPRLTSDGLQRLYDDPAYFEDRVYGAKPWSGSSILQRIWTKGRLDAIERARGATPQSSSMLEVGCGFGHFLSDSRSRGYAVSGVELSKTGATYATDELDLEVFCGQLEEATFDKPFDVICAWDTIEHVPDPVSFLTSVRDRLADDGLLAFSTPSFASAPARLLKTRWWTLKPTEHIWHFTPETHALVLAAAGLELVDVVTNPVSPANFGRFDSLVGFARRRHDGSR